MAITAETNCSVQITRTKKHFLSLHYNGSNSFLYAKCVKIYQFKAKDSEINRFLLRLGSISKYFMVCNMKKVVLNGYVYDFSVD